MLSKAAVRPLRSSTVESLRPVCQPAAPAASVSRARCLLMRTYTPAAPGSPVADNTQKSFLDIAVATVLSLFDDDKQAQASEELQLPPELKAYLDEMEAHGSGSHGGWVHSHIADRLASEDLAE